MLVGRGRTGLGRFLRRRRPDAGSMPLAMLVTLVGVTLSAGLSGLVVGQIKASQRVANRVAAVNAAQAGLDAGLAQIRGSITGLAGDLSKLPCTAITGTLPLPAGPSAATPDYRVTIGYFLADPSNLANTLTPIGDLTNLHDLVAGTPLTTVLAPLDQGITESGRTAIERAAEGAVGCVDGALRQVPLFGLLRSIGTAGGVRRTLWATYTFRTSEETIPGGRIVIAGTDDQLCLGARSRPDGQPPQAGDEVAAVPCDGPDEHVKFIYPRNLSLSLAKSRTSKLAEVPYGLCITALAQRSNAPVTFEPCAARTIPAQRWSYEVNQQTYSGTTDGMTSSGFCLVMRDQGRVHSAIVLMKGDGNCGTSKGPGRAFIPDPLVGSGAAGINTGQFVNFAEVGRCLDLTNEDPDGTWFTSRGRLPALITYPCKQSFDGQVFWNHAWARPAIAADAYQATGQISTTPDGGPFAGKAYCLNSPGPAGGYVWVARCAAGNPTMRWTVYDAAPLVSQAYRVVDSYGNCLEAAGSRGPAYRYLTWSEVITTTCNGSGVQKWNAPRTLGAGPLTGIQER